MLMSMVMLHVSVDFFVLLCAYAYVASENRALRQILTASNMRLFVWLLNKSYNHIRHESYNHIYCET